MGLTQAAIWGAAVVALLALPCAVIALRGADEAALRRREWSRRPLEETQALRALDRAMQQRDDIPVLDDAPAQAIDEIARELRRLDRQRRGGPTLESERWREAVLQAYDEGLCRACRCMGVQEHLEPLEGMDREIERVRVEGALQAAGVALR
ncbi:MAG TPA: hypothetical protein VGD29_31645 [Actinoplanes sp.]